MRPSSDARRPSISRYAGVVVVHTCECAGGKIAVPTELFEERPLGVDRSAARSMFDAGKQVSQFVVVLATFDGERTLPHLRKHHIGRQQLGHGFRASETLERYRRDNDGVVFGGSLESCRDVAPQVGEREVGPAVGELRTATGRARGHAAARGDRRKRRTHQRVADFPSLWYRRQNEPVDLSRRKVLGRMHGHVGAAGEHRSLDLLDEHTLAAHLPDLDVLPAIAGRVDDHLLDVDAGVDGAQPTTRHGRLASGPARCRRRRHAKGQRSNRSRSASARRSPFAVPDASLSRTVGSWISLRDDPLRQCFDGGALAVVELGESSVHALELAAADRLRAIAKGRDQRRRFASGRERAVASQLFFDQRARRGASRWRSATPASTKRRRSSMSSSVTPSMSPADGSTSRGMAMSTISSGRPLRLAMAVVEVGVLEHDVRRARRREQDVGSRELRGEIGQAHRSPFEAGSERLRSFPRAVGDDDVHVTRGSDGHRHGFGHVAGAEQQHAAAGQRAQTVGRHRNGRLRDRCDAAADARLGADPLPTSSAWRKSRLSDEAVAPSARARSHAAPTWPRISLSPKTAESSPAATENRCAHRRVVVMDVQMAGELVRRKE